MPAKCLVSRVTEHARFAIGGLRRGGDILPGILHEVLLSLEQRHPVCFAGGFGGTTIDIVAALDPSCRALHAPTAGPIAPRALPAFDDLARRAAAQGGWALLNNGLDADENRRLAATHRPSEIAALVVTGHGARLLACSDAFDANGIVDLALIPECSARGGAVQFIARAADLSWRTPVF